MQQSTTSETTDLGLSNLQAELARKILILAQDGQWSEGEHVSEIRLADTLGTSRTPVRHVLVALEKRGVFTKIPNVGFRFAGLPNGGQEIEDALPHSETELLYERVMTARATGEIATEVSETELTEHFGTTRGVIRRVLMRLANSGLAERRTGHGWRFAETLDNKAAIEASYVFRAIIECGAVRDGDFRPDFQQLRELRAQQRKLLEKPVGRISGSGWFEANANFHATIVGWAHNRFLNEAIERQNNLRRMTEVAEFTVLTAEGIRKAARDHLAILDAIEAGDREEAVAILNRHLSRSRKNGGELD
ncbi:GntR family transcriptional regulator [uncultured Nitratireductor sp.]|uniref:GntR family transcriptional regulator n=1 Tax=uncultured Nitratireductor sp. TaxID=520953 RepID=UPI0025DE20D4|nr:GntR family transcriptional regulator [uncultured Nitratireductor sp.]